MAGTRYTGGEEMEVTFVRTPRSMKRRITAAAEAEGLSVSEFVRRAVKATLPAEPKRKPVVR